MIRVYFRTCSIFMLFGGKKYAFFICDWRRIALHIIIVGQCVALRTRKCKMHREMKRKTTSIPCTGLVFFPFYFYFYLVCLFLSLFDVISVWW